MQAVELEFNRWIALAGNRNMSWSGPITSPTLQKRRDTMQERTRLDEAINELFQW